MIETLRLGGGCGTFIGLLLILWAFFVNENAIVPGFLLVGVGALMLFIVNKRDKSVVLSESDGLKEESEINLGTPNKSSGIELNQIWKGGDSIDIEQKGLLNFYDESFTIIVKKLKGKIIHYKYDDVISQTEKAGIMTLPQQFMFFYTNDDKGYVIEFDSVADKLALVDKCKNLGVKKDDATNTDSAIPSSTADELKKFKELLDSGAITQEEYDAKKKELLDL